MDRLVALQDLNISLAFVDRRTSAISPLIGERSIFLLQIVCPNLFPVQIEPGQVAVAVEEHDYFSVRHWRRRSEITSVVKAIANGNLLVPNLLAGIAIEAQRAQSLCFIIGGADEDLVVPNDGRRGGICRQ